MDILVISALIFFGLLFCVVELLILPGVTLGGILSVVCNGGAIYMAFGRLGVVGGIIVVVLIAVLTCVAIAFSLRAKTWDRFSLKSKIDSASSDTPQTKVIVGQRGVAISRLAPMGKVEIEGSSYEAKSSDAYIDAKSAVEVVGFDNFSVVVKRVENI
ncbi:MAG: NfeD family protein [Rikenellaceae bacterium]